MPTSANHDIPTPAGSDPATIPAHMKAMADKIDSELDAIAPSQITGVAAGKVLLANGAGVVTPQAIMGDATISSSGDLQIAGSAVDTPEIKDRAVSTAKLGDGSVTRGKMAPWFQPTIATTAGTVSPGTLTAMIVSHGFGHTNYIALITPQTSTPMAVSWGKGNLIGQEPGEQITILMKNVGSSSISNPTFSVVFMSLA